ncbi:3'-5' exonuclease [Sunxiuqinia indica]|uniref:3'-5' exonuclease n=1 Tax=Sunxiuqinia indica TaxID=2692584 RepID=UPI00135A4B4D|nr:3'-5' exonuclease [Sunxiuqinia indica]
MNDNILFFDTETTGLPLKGAKYEIDYDTFPYVVQLSWWFEDVFHDYIIKPDGCVIPESSTEIHGITHEMAMNLGVPFKDVIPLFVHDCLSAEKIVGHNMYFDTSIIKANVIRNFGVDDDFFADTNKALDKYKRIDTMYKSMKYVGARKANGSGKFPTLEELYLKLFNETFPAHNSLEDVKATMRCFNKLNEMGIV